MPHEWRGTDFLSTLVTTFFGSGMSPKAPGTMGSLAATILAYPMALVAENLLGETIWFRLFFLFAAIAVFFGAIPFVNKAMKDTGTEDPGWIVIDEVCGIFMTFAFINPSIIMTLPYITLPLGFGLFRFFDISIHSLKHFKFNFQKLNWRPHNCYFRIWNN